MDIFLNQLIQFYSNKATNLHRLTTHSSTMLTYKMAIVLRPQICHVISPYVYGYVYYWYSVVVRNGTVCFGCCRMQADRLSAGQHPHQHHHHHQQQQQSVDQSARSVTTIMFPPVNEQVQTSAGSTTAAAASGTSRDRPSSTSSSAFLLTKFVHSTRLRLFLVRRPGYKKDQNCANCVYKHQNTFFVNVKYSRIAWDIDTSTWKKLNRLLCHFIMP